MKKETNWPDGNWHSTWLDIVGRTTVATVKLEEVGKLGIRIVANQIIASAPNFVVVAEPRRPWAKSEPGRDKERDRVAQTSHQEQNKLVR